MQMFYTADHKAHIHKLDTEHDMMQSVFIQTRVSDYPSPAPAKSISASPLHLPPVRLTLCCINCVLQLSDHMPWHVQNQGI